jgi:hypothetical protein
MANPCGRSSEILPIYIYVHFKMHPKFHFVIHNKIKPEIQIIEGAGTAHHFPECKHSLG